jgi:hypothetical protein
VADDVADQPVPGARVHRLFAIVLAGPKPSSSAWSVYGVRTISG